MNTTTPISTDKVFIALWHAKLEAEATYRALVAQGLTEEADIAWERFLNICHQILDYRVSL